MSKDIPAKPVKALKEKTARHQAVAKTAPPSGKKAAGAPQQDHSTRDRKNPLFPDDRTTIFLNRVDARKAASLLSYLHQHSIKNAKISTLLRALLHMAEANPTLVATVRELHESRYRR
ncbi:MAG TPA: hypothetical protein VIS99_12805 [Terrimicrobiaceae bacterium]